jgi:dienelactone hydrolase
MKALLGFAILLIAATAQCKITSKIIEYKEGETVLEGFLAMPAKPGKYRSVIVVHDWMGLRDGTKERAKQLAELGYVAFAADIYGKDSRPKDSKEASALAGKFKGDRKLLRARARAAYDELLKQKMTVGEPAIMGYCFGGTTALELARDGAEIAGAISFHGGLSTPNPADAKNIKGKILVLHGADDPNVNEKEVSDFEKEMRDAKVDWQLVAYGGAVHSFTIKEAGNDNSKGAAYNELADKRSWEAMKVFFKEIF